MRTALREVSGGSTEVSKTTAGAGLARSPASSHQSAAAHALLTATGKETAGWSAVTRMACAHAVCKMFRHLCCNNVSRVLVTCVARFQALGVVLKVLQSVLGSVQGVPVQNGGERQMQRTADSESSLSLRP